MPKYMGLARYSIEASNQFTVEADTKEEALKKIQAAADQSDLDAWAQEGSPIEVDLEEIHEDPEA